MKLAFTVHLASIFALAFQHAGAIPTDGGTSEHMPSDKFNALPTELKRMIALYLDGYAQMQMSTAPLLARGLVQKIQEPPTTEAQTRGNSATDITKGQSIAHDVMNLTKHATIVAFKEFMQSNTHSITWMNRHAVLSATQIGQVGPTRMLLVEPLTKDLLQVNFPIFTLAENLTTEEFTNFLATLFGYEYVIEVGKSIADLFPEPCQRVAQNNIAEALPYMYRMVLSHVTWYLYTHTSFDKVQKYFESSLAPRNALQVNSQMNSRPLQARLGAILAASRFAEAPQVATVTDSKTQAVIQAEIAYFWNQVNREEEFMDPMGEGYLEFGDVFLPCLRRYNLIRAHTFFNQNAGSLGLVAEDLRNEDGLLLSDIGDFEMEGLCQDVLFDLKQFRLNDTEGFGFTVVEPLLWKANVIQYTFSAME
ncbi:hypothetical protein H4R33_005733 [Dimargaris cristalligena]|nr:hypothetical protein H4R33_005733 [Dimargaris cristalligena]